MNGVGLWQKGCWRPHQGLPDVIGYQACEQLYGLAREVQRIQRAQLSKLVELSQRVASSYHHPGHIHQLEISIQGCSATLALKFSMDTCEVCAVKIVSQYTKYRNTLFE